MRNPAPTILAPNHHAGSDHAIGQIDLIGEDREILTSWRIRSPKCSIGSSSECTVQIASGEIAPLHATLIFGKKHTLLRAVSPTFISNRPIREWLIDESTEIVIGKARLVVYPTVGLVATVVPATSLVDQAARLCKEPTPIVHYSETTSSHVAVGIASNSESPAPEIQASAADTVGNAAASKLENIESLLQSLQASLEKIQTTLGNTAQSTNVAIVESVTQEIDEFGKKLFTNLNDQLSSQTGVQQSLISDLSEKFVDRLGAIDDQLNNHTGVQQMLISNLADRFTDRFGAIDEQLNRFNETNSLQSQSIQELLAHARSEQQLIETKFQEVVSHRNELVDAVHVLRSEIASAHQQQSANHQAISDEIRSLDLPNVMALAANSQTLANNQQLAAESRRVTDEQLAHSLELAQTQIQELNAQLRELRTERDTAQSRIDSLSESWRSASTTEATQLSVLPLSVPPLSVHQYEAQQHEAQQHEAQQHEAPQYEAPQYEAPQYEAPQYEAPQYEAPQYEAPQYEAPQYEAPQYEAPQYEAPQYEAPQYEAPQYEAPQYEAPQYEAPQYEAPQYEAPQYEAPQYEAPQYEAPQYESPQYEAPQYEAPQYEAPQYEAPQYEAPQYEAPQYEAPQYEAPQYEAPQSSEVPERPALPSWFKQDDSVPLTETSIALSKLRAAEANQDYGTDHSSRAEQAESLNESISNPSDLSFGVDSEYANPNADSLSDRLQRMLSDASSRKGNTEATPERISTDAWSQKMAKSAAKPDSVEIARPPIADSTGLPRFEQYESEPAEVESPVAETADSDDGFPSSMRHLFRENAEIQSTPADTRPAVHSEPIQREVHEPIRTPSPVSEPRAELAEANEEVANEEESIEQYMQRLLSRVRGGSESEAAKNSELIKAQPSPVNAAVAPVKKGSRVAASMGLDSEPYATPADKLSEELFVPRQQPPEQRNDLVALRELANTNARRAINRSDIRRTNSAFYFKLGVTALAVSSAVGIFLINGFKLNAPFAGMVSAIVVAFLWGADCLNHFRCLRNAEGMAPVSAAETAAGQTIQVGSDDNGWRPTPA